MSGGGGGGNDDLCDNTQFFDCMNRNLNLIIDTSDEDVTRIEDNTKILIIQEV
jgi:hypothetical protein